MLEMGDAPGAHRRLTEAYDMAVDVELLPQVCIAAAALAECAVLQAQLDEALKYVKIAWDFLQTMGLIGLDNPAMIYRQCAEVYDALGDEETVQVALESGYRTIMDVANRITITEWKQSFLENEPLNRAFLELCERRKYRPG
jgi:hypothetical protein